mgnify:FL=1
MEKNILGTRLRKLRNSKKLSQPELAEKFGLTKYQVSRYENGESNPDPDVISKFAEYFEVTTDYLLGRTDNPQGYSDFDPIAEHNRLLKKYGIEDSGFFDIEKWKQMGPEELKQLENYFKFIVEQAKNRDKERDSE